MKNFFLGGVIGVMLIVCILFLCAFLFFLSIFGAISATFSNVSSTSSELITKDENFLQGSLESNNKILQINIDGTILNERPSDGFSSLLADGVVYGYEIKDQLIYASQDDSIKAIFLRVNSPGGTITGSQAILDGLTYFKEKTGKPIYGFGSGIVASGGYWVMMGTDKIFLDIGSIAGSIGVISGELVYFNKLIANGGQLTEGGIEVEYITAGEGKDLGTPFRRATEKEKEILQKGADNAYEVFVSIVSEARNISKDKIRDNIGAYIYGNDQAIELGLVDETANREDVLAKLVSELSLEDYKLFEYKRSDGFFSFLFGITNPVVSRAQLNPAGCNESRKVLALHGDPTQICRFF